MKIVRILNLTVILTTLVLSACQSTTPFNVKPLDHALDVAELPEYEIGHTRIVLDQNGKEIVQTVSAVTENSITWKTSAGEIWTDDVNFALATQYWSSSNWGTGTQVNTVWSGELFPLVIGKTVQFDVVGFSDQYPSGWKNERLCEVDRQTRIQVPAGEFEAFEIKCSDDHSVRTYYYAPDVNYIVAYEDRHIGGINQVDRWQAVSFDTGVE